MSATEKLTAVIAAGQASRVALAHDLAKAFRRDPGCFDPRSLERLGTSGLPQFLEAIGASAKSSRPYPPARGNAIAAPAAQTVARARGWSHLRRPERPIWIAGVAAGTRASALAAGAAAIAIVCTERLLPLAREVLS